MRDVIVRKVEQLEAEALACLIVAFRDHLKAAAPTDAALARRLPLALSDPSIEFSCAWLDGRAAGYTQIRFHTSVWADGVEACLEDLFVARDFRKRSIGRSLLRHALSRAEDRGATRLSLNTNERNTAAQSLYRSEGLSPQTHALYPGGHEVVWSKDLSAA